MPQTSRVGESLMEAYGKKILSVVYWRFFVNLVFCGTISFIVAVILMLQGGVNRRSARFHFNINLWMYAVLCALLITMALRLIARQQIHRICGRSIAVLPLPVGVAQYNQTYATCMLMLIKSGVTGPWQVSGRSDLSQWSLNPWT